MNILVTGAAGFIGYHTCARLLEDGHTVTGIDSLNDYYDVQLKKDRVAQLADRERFQFLHMDFADQDACTKLFNEQRFDRVIHLGAQAGVRYSIENPRAYIDANIVGFLNILEGCRHNQVGHLVYASSSSVYGANTKQPFSEDDNVDHPVSLYAASKKSNELMAHTYSNLYEIPTTGLRFFTVYGPWGRPDMALFKFTKGIISETAIDVYNHGNMFRDFTYIDDIVESLVRISDKMPTPDPDWKTQHKPSSSFAPYRIYNIGNNAPVRLMDFVEAIETAVGKKAVINFMDMQPGDVPSTYADSEALVSDINFAPSTTIEVGVRAFVDWYRHYYRA